MTIMHIHRLFDKRVIAFYPALRKITGSITAAIMLQQLLYWWERRSGDSIYKTVKEMEEETSLTEKEQRNAIARLVKVGFITTFVKGVPPKRHFVLHLDAINKALMKLMESDDDLNGCSNSSPNPPKGRDQIRPKGGIEADQRAGSYKESKESEITTEITAESKPQDRATISRPVVTSNDCNCYGDETRSQAHEQGVSEDHHLHGCESLETESHDTGDESVNGDSVDDGDSIHDDIPHGAALASLKRTFRNSIYAGRVPREWINIAIEHGLSERDARIEAGAFERWFVHGKGRRKLRTAKGWELSWRKWIEKHKHYDPNPAPLMKRLEDQERAWTEKVERRGANDWDF